MFWKKSEKRVADIFEKIHEGGGVFSSMGAHRQIRRNLRKRFRCGRFGDGVNENLAFFGDGGLAVKEISRLS